VFDLGHASVPHAARDDATPSLFLVVCFTNFLYLPMMSCKAAVVTHTSGSAIQETKTSMMEPTTLIFLFRGSLGALEVGDWSLC